MLDLRRIDLNLLVALQTLLEEQHVTRAAARLSITQPAMSRTLARLRQLFGDPLFVRTPSGLAPTPRAEQLRDRLDSALADITRLVSPTEFDPATARGRWRFATTDYGTHSIMPRVLARIWREAPGMDIDVLPWRSNGLAMLESGELDLALASTGTAPASIHGRGLGDDNFVALVRQGHPVLETGLDLASFLALPQILIHSGSGDLRGPIDHQLDKIGQCRRVAVRVPSFMAALALAARTDMLVNTPQMMARLYAESAGLVPLPLPLDLPNFSYGIVWHERWHHDPGHSWLRTLCFEESTALLTEVCGSNKRQAAEARIQT